MKPLGTGAGAVIDWLNWTWASVTTKGITGPSTTVKGGGDELPAGGLLDGAAPALAVLAAVARHLLMPEEVVRGAVDSRQGASGRIDADRLCEVARQFDVSVEAVLWQMRFVSHIPSEKVRGYLDQLRPRMASWNPFARATPPERPSRFLALARQALRKGLISTGRYAGYVGISRRDAMKVVEEHAQADVQIEVAHP